MGPPPRVRLWIDWTACGGRGWCTELLPELLVQDPEGYPWEITGDSRVDPGRPAGTSKQPIAEKRRGVLRSRPETVKDTTQTLRLEPSVDWPYGQA